VETSEAPFAGSRSKAVGDFSMQDEAFGRACRRDPPCAKTRIHGSSAEKFDLLRRFAFLGDPTGEEIGSKHSEERLEPLFGGALCAIGLRWVGTEAEGPAPARILYGARASRSKGRAPGDPLTE